MHNSIDTIAAQCKKFRHVTLTEEETGRYIPNLDSKVKEYRHKSNSSARFSVTQGGYLIDAYVTYFNETYRVNIYTVEKQRERQKNEARQLHRGRYG